MSVQLITEEHEYHMSIGMIEIQIKVSVLVPDIWLMVYNDRGNKLKAPTGGQTETHEHVVWLGVNIHT